MIDNTHIPTCGETYGYFDDGKIRKSRHDLVTITEIVPYQMIEKETLDEWKEELKSCYWLYRADTDYFIRGHLHRMNEDIIFVRTTDNKWFSLGWWAGSLDINGSLTEILNEQYK